MLEKKVFKNGIQEDKSLAIESIVDGLFKHHLDKECYEEILAELPTDIYNWKIIIDHIVSDTGNENSIPVIMLWILKLSINPFDHYKMLKEKHIGILTKFLLDYLLEAKQWPLKKYALKALAFLARCMLDNGCKFESIASNPTPHFLLIDRKVQEQQLFCFLKYLSFISTVPSEFLEIKENDQIVTKRYKIKIMSHLSSKETVIKDLNTLFSILNLENSKLGWTLCKSIYRMSRFVDKNTLISDLKALLGPRIFANEQCWINVFTLFSFFILDDKNSLESVGNLLFVNIALKYDQEFVSRSTAVRETALFFIWVLARNRCLIEPYSIIYRVVFISLFDREFICRRAAVNVVQELVGAGYFKELNNTRDENPIFKICQSLVKRRSDCYKLFITIEDKQNYKEAVFEMLFSFDRESRELAAQIISNFLYPCNVPLKYKTVTEMDTTHLLAYYTFKFALSESDRNTHLNVFKPYIDTFLLDNQKFKLRNMAFAIDSYLKIASLFNKASFSANILFLISKNFSPLQVQKYSCVLFENNLQFSEKVFSLIEKNNTGILSNANNIFYRDQIVIQLEKNLQKGNFVEYSIHALRIMKVVDKVLLVKRYLEDYTVDFNGDAGYVHRRAALWYCFSILDMSTAEVEDEMERYLIRFMADKSKKLRDEILESLLRTQFSIYDHETQRQSSLEITLPIKRNIKRFERFFKSYDQSLKLLSTERAYFRALFIAFSDMTDFWIGISKTAKNADRYLINVLEEEVFSKQSADREKL
ncbi:hypothetical protein GINT2_001309 [Glugoides intestinalis]